MIYCFGDSLTEGRPGVTYVKYLSAVGKCENCGLGGDTVTGVAKRLKDRLPQKLDDSDYVVLGCGTNDILMPYFESCGESWRSAAQRHAAAGSIPAKDIDDFREKYLALVRYIRGITGHLIVFGLPLLETTEDGLDAACARYSLAVADICRQENIPFVDFREWEIGQKTLLHNKGSFFMTSDNRTHDNIIKDVFWTTFLPCADWVSRKRGLAVTIDGCHLNTRSAKGLAALLAAHIG